MPISVSLKNRTCLVVGGGVVALRKVENLLDYRTDITVIAPEVDRKLAYFAEQERIKLEKRSYKSPEAAAYGLVIAATDDRPLNRRVSDDARGAGVLVNVADDPELCDFIFPSVVRRNFLTTAVSTDGQAPFMAGHLRGILNEIFPKHWEKLMGHAATYRRMVRERYADNALKREYAFERFVEADWKKMLKELSAEEVEAALQSMLAGAPEPAES
jgi:uroporphyrin-III C-methyltransferase/precorrin-2 dehydrogenase/sirohydrochlorin ferrochelatase